MNDEIKGLLQDAYFEAQSDYNDEEWSCFDFTQKIKIIYRKLSYSDKSKMMLHYFNVNCEYFIEYVKEEPNMVISALFDTFSNAPLIDALEDDFDVCGTYIKRFLQGETPLNLDIRCA